jgi:hypothetical protein
MFCPIDAGMVEMDIKPEGELRGVEAIAID